MYVSFFSETSKTTWSSELAYLFEFEAGEAVYSF